MVMTDRASTQREDAALSLTVAVVAASSGPLLLLDGALNVIAASGSFFRTFQIDPATVAGRQIFALGAGEWDVPPFRALLKAAAAGEAPDACEIDLVREGQEPRRLAVQADRLVYLDLEQVRVLVAVADITDARAAEKRADDLRRYNALQLQEVRHRIANNLEMVASVLRLDARRSGSQEASNRLESAYQRVLSVAAVERQLSSSGEDAVHLRPYLVELCEMIGASVIDDPKRVSLEVVAEDVTVDASTSVSLGLIVTELVINAIKHAFPEGLPGKIEVSYATHGEGWTLRVRDNGVGVPTGHDATVGLGTKIVNALARQLRALMSVGGADGGGSISISYPAPAGDDLQRNAVSRGV
jgi:two-component system, sensor histidine kinase PdtaS